LTQGRIRDQLAHIKQPLKITDLEHQKIHDNLTAALALVTNAQDTHDRAPDTDRREINRARFSRLHVDQDGTVRAELAPPFDILLSPETRSLAHESGRPQTST
jgi:hypothetical protein